MDNGDWIILENAHFALNTTKEIYFHYQTAIKTKEINDKFRLWFITNPSTKLPIEMLRHSIKLCINIPQNFPKQFHSMNDKYQNEFPFETISQSKHSLWKKIIYELIKFHAVLIKRSGYDASGWTEQYLFSKNICKHIISNMNLISQNECNITNGMIKRLVLDCYYMRMVWKAADQILLHSMFLNIFSNELSTEDEESTYELDTFLNSNVNYLQNEKCSEYFTSTFINARKNSFSPAMNINNTNGINDDMVLIKCKEILNILPIELKCSIVENEQFENIIKNETLRYNKLLKRIRNDMNELYKSLCGKLDMTNDMEDIFNDILENRMPMQWMVYSYPTKKSFATYIKDLGQRIDFFNNLKRSRTSCGIWFSAFFQPMSLITTIKRRFSKLNGIQFNDVIVNHSIVDTIEVY